LRQENVGNGQGKTALFLSVDTVKPARMSHDAAKAVACLRSPNGAPISDPARETTRHPACEIIDRMVEDR
jgi:hypothetical protein